jgi:hypothetical protein
MHPESLRDGGQNRRELLGRLWAAHLGRGTDRDVEDDVGGADGDLLGEDGGDELALGRRRQPARQPRDGRVQWTVERKRASLLRRCRGSPQ